MWEYFLETSIELLPEDRLNELGKERWELIQIVYRQQFFSQGRTQGGFHYYFKRPPTGK